MKNQRIASNSTTVAYGAAIISILASFGAGLSAAGTVYAAVAALHGSDLTGLVRGIVLTALLFVACVRYRTVALRIAGKTPLASAVATQPSH